MIVYRFCDYWGKGMVRVNDDSVITYNVEERVIYVSKHQLAPEDRVTFSFASVLDRTGIEYVIVAGYIAILLGRARRSDDIDFILGELDETRFEELCNEALKAGFTLMQGVC